MNYIIESKPNILNNIDKNKIYKIENSLIKNTEISIDDINYLLDYLCFAVRSMFTNDLENYSFEYKCDTVQAIVYYYLESLGIKVYACQTQNAISNSIIGHSFITCIINNTPYLIDPTYRQFFLCENCSESNYIEIDNKVIKTPDPGYFIKDVDKDLISSFLKNGYSILNEDIARAYGDSFYNTKVLSGKEYKSFKGSIYINAFLRNTSTLSKLKEELEDFDLLIKIGGNKTL